MSTKGTQDTTTAIRAMRQVMAKNSNYHITIYNNHFFLNSNFVLNVNSKMDPAPVMD